MRPSPVLVLMLIMAIPQLMKAWKYDPRAPENQAYYGVSNEQKLTYGAAYIALVGFLAVMAQDVHVMLRGAGLDG